MKISKELKAGLITVIAIGLLVGGVNFLKGNSFFGGDDQYVAYFPNSGGLSPATSVYVNGVVVGKVLSVDYNLKGDSATRVKVVFNIQEENFKIPKGSILEIGSFDLFNKGILLTLNSMPSEGYYTTDDVIYGSVAQDMMSQVKAYADPITQKLQVLMGNVDRTITSLKGFWDTTATTEIQTSLAELKNAFRTFGRVANEVEGLVATEKVRLSHIFTNVESITQNIKNSNDKIESILGNFKTMSDNLVSVDFKKTIADANATIVKLNTMLEEVNNGNGTLGKLVKDEKLYNELIATNKSLQSLVEDLELHPERYIHFSVLGAKTKGAPLKPSEERKLRKLLDSIPD